MVSTDRGITVNINSLEKSTPSNAYEGPASTAHGCYGDIHYNFKECDFGTTTDCKTNASTVLNIVVGGTTYYKMRGWYVTGAAYETYVVTDPTASPPSGHTLTNTIIEYSWTV